MQGSYPCYKLKRYPTTLDGKLDALVHPVSTPPIQSPSEDAVEFISKSDGKLVSTGHQGFSSKGLGCKRSLTAWNSSAGHDCAEALVAGKYNFFATITSTRYRRLENGL